MGASSTLQGSMPPTTQYTFVASTAMLGMLAGTHGPGGTRVTGTPPPMGTFMTKPPG